MKGGFANLSKEAICALAGKAGRAAHAMGRAHRFTSETAREAGRAGGLSLSKDREHMATIGKRGGAATAARCGAAVMAKIGHLGGVAKTEAKT